MLYRLKLLTPAMLRTTALVTFCTGGYAFSQPAPSLKQPLPAKPNIIIILSDDMGYSDLGCFGSEIRTPNLDRLAENGIRFTHFYNNARSSPSRASLLTGLYAHQAQMGHLATASPHTQEGYRDELSHNAVTIAEVLGDHGYTTYMAGKWHLTKALTDTSDKSNWPLQRGFDRYFGTINGSGSYYDPGTLTSGNKFIAPGKNFYYTDAISDTAAKFIMQHNSDNPFFIYVAYTAAHWPLHAPEKEIARYKGIYDIGWDSLRVLRFNKLKKLGIISDNCVLTQRGVEVPEWNKEPMKEWQTRRMEVYAAMIDIMDQGIGRIISALEQKGQLENTIILYMQDNGGCAEPQGTKQPAAPLTAEQKILKPMPVDYIRPTGRVDYTRDGRYIRRGSGVMAGDADTWVAYGEEWANVSNTPYREYKQWVHEGGIASPLIVHWPSGIKTKGKINHDVTHLIDIMPTCLEIAGAIYPGRFGGNEIIPQEGKSLTPAFTSKKIKRDYLIWEHSANRAIRMGDWKLVSKVKNQMEFTQSDMNNWELYNLRNDPSETVNLSGKYPERVNKMAAKWETEAIRVKMKPWPWDN